MKEINCVGVMWMGTLTDFNPIDLNIIAHHENHHSVDGSTK